MRKSIHLRSAAESCNAVRNDGEVIVIELDSSRLIKMSEYFSFCCNRRLFVDPTT